MSDPYRTPGVVRAPPAPKKLPPCKNCGHPQGSHHAFRGGSAFLKHDKTGWRIPTKDALPAEHWCDAIYVKLFSNMHCFCTRYEEPPPKKLSACKNCGHPAINHHIFRGGSAFLALASARPVKHSCDRVKLFSRARCYCSLYVEQK